MDSGIVPGAGVRFSFYSFADRDNIDHYRFSNRLVGTLRSRKNARYGIIQGNLPRLSKSGRIQESLSPHTLVLIKDKVGVI